MTDHADPFERARELHAAGDHAGAKEQYRAILAEQPDDTRVLAALGTLCLQTSRPHEAEQHLQRAVTLEPGNPQLLNKLGLALRGIGHPSAAAERFVEAIELRPRSSQLHVNLGTVLDLMQRTQEAVPIYMKGVELDPENPDAHHRLGHALRAVGADGPAIDAFRTAVSLDPALVEAWEGLASALTVENLVEDAIATVRHALSLHPGAAGLHRWLGDALQVSGRVEESVPAYERAAELVPDEPRTWHGLGFAQVDLGDHAAAARSLNRCLQLMPDDPIARYKLAEASVGLGEPDRALDLFLQVRADRIPALERNALDSIATLATSAPGADHARVLALRRDWAGNYAPEPASPPFHQMVGQRNGDRVRVGYVSCFFESVDSMKPVWSLLRQHDREKFEVHLFSDTPGERLRPLLGNEPLAEVHDIGGMTNVRAARNIAKVGIDVLVDLNGFEHVARLPMFVMRPAPRLVAWFNAAGTTGMPCFDVLVGDDVVVREEEEEHYVESIERVPGSYLAFDVPYEVPDVAPPPGAAAGRLTLGSLCSLDKITPQVIETWAEILRAAPACGLLLRNRGLRSEANREYVLGRFAEHGIDRERLELLGPTEHLELLRTYDRIDVALDTFPCSDPKTTSEALWQGVPVVTYTGDRWIARRSASLLRAAGLDDFVADDLETYVALTTGLAAAEIAPAHLSELRSGMRARLMESAACDTSALARSMEAIYERIVVR